MKLYWEGVPDNGAVIEMPISEALFNNNPAGLEPGNH